MSANSVIRILVRLRSELGVDSIRNSSKDTKILCLQRFTRLFAYGASTLILALYLSSVGVSDVRIGLFMTLTLLGDVVISLILTLFADGLGRRRILIIGAGLMSASGTVFALSSNYWVLLIASIVGVISPSGSEIGPFKAIEESTLAQLTSSDLRSDIFAWYMLIGTAGAACGSFICGWVVEELQSSHNWSDVRAYRLIFGGYACLGVSKLILSLLLSQECEPKPEKKETQDEFELDAVEVEGLLSDDEEDQLAMSSKPKPTPEIPFTRKPKPIWPDISPSSRTILAKLCLLFAADSFASGLVPQSWIIYFFDRKFSLPEGQLGTLGFFTYIIASASNLVASAISKRIGFIKTMVFTHLPSAIFLALIPLPSNVGLSVMFLALRSSMQSMDQAPRQAFLASVVLPRERTAVMGVVNVGKTLSQSGGPVITGWLAETNRLWLSFLLAGALKASYDLAMLKMFLGYKPRDIEGAEREPARNREPQNRSNPA